MEKVPQRVERKMTEIYADAPIAHYGKRKPDFSTMGRKITNQFKNFREIVERHAELPTVDQEESLKILQPWNLGQWQSRKS